MKPLAVFSLTICTHRDQRSRKKLKVFLWQRVRDLRAAAKASSIESAYFWRKAGGAYVAKSVYQDGRLRQFGEIHLWEKLIGAGYVAHEIQHFMLDYTHETENWPLDHEANERMSWLAGDLTTQFWTKFYERFDLQPGMK